MILPLVVFAISITLKGIFFEWNNSAAPPAASRKQNVPSKAAPYQLYPAGIYIALIESTKYATLAASPLFFGFTRGWSERACIFYFVLCSLFDILARVAVALLFATFARKRGVLSLAIRFTTTCLAAVLRWGIYSNPEVGNGVTEQWIPQGDEKMWFLSLFFYFAVSCSLTTACTDFSTRCSDICMLNSVSNLSHSATWRFRVAGRVLGGLIIWSIVYFSGSFIRINSLTTYIFVLSAIVTTLGAIGFMMNNHAKESVMKRGMLKEKREFI